MLRRIVLVEVPVARRDGQRAAVRHGVARVVDDVDETRLELGRIGDDRPDVVRQIERDLDVLAERAAEELADPGDELVDVDALRLQRLAAGEGEEALGQIGAAQRRIEGFAGKLRRLGVSCVAARLEDRGCR